MASILDTTIFSRTSPVGLRPAIIQEIFGVDIGQDEGNSCFKGLNIYFTEWYEDHCKQCIRQICVATHSELLDIVAMLRTSRDDQASLVRDLSERGRASNANSKQFEATIILAARLLSMLSIGEIDNCIPPGRTVIWQQGPLRESIATGFPASKIEESENLPKIFKATNLKKFAGIEVRWTNNLADHLSMEGDEVRIFHHVSFLELHRAGASELYPAGLVEETFRTLALLIPSNDAKSVKWFQKQRAVKLDPLAAACGQLNSADRHTGKFNYWRDRIVILKQAFDESEPSSVSHWWYDDRKKVQWWTFWIAALVLLLTVVFGLIQSITSIISAWAALQTIPI